MCSVDYDVCETWLESFPTAAKVHACTVCDALIPKGNVHCRLFSVFDGSCSTSRECLLCRGARHLFARSHGQSPHPTMLEEELRGCIDWEEKDNAKEWRDLLAGITRRRKAAKREARP